MSQYQDTIEGLELQERSAERKAAEQQVQDEKEELYKVGNNHYIMEHVLSSTYQAAYIDGLEDNSLYKVLFKEDVEAPRLQHLPGVDEMLQQYTSQNR